MNNSKTLIGLIVAGLFIVAIIGWFTPVLPKANSIEGLNTGSMAAEDYNPYIMYNGGYYSAKPIETTSTLTAAGAVAFASTLAVTGDATVSGGTLNLTTSNSATSTAVVGCVQTYATSTATAIQLIIGSPNTQASSTLASQTIGGFVAWRFGACPAL